MNSNNELKSLTLLYLYPEQMNIYGDHGNILTLVRRAHWHGYDLRVIPFHPGKQMHENIDLVVGGGGQDSGQSIVQDDLLRIGDDIKNLADKDVPMLVICGLYQLFGHFFKPHEGPTIRGIGLFDLETHGRPKRLVGNIVASSDFGDLIGYETHSGITTLGSNQQPLARVIKGAGNNGKDKTEGARYRRAYGSYMHGSLLPKNPTFADALIEAAALHRYGEFEPQIIDDHLAESARAVARNRPR